MSKKERIGFLKIWIIVFLVFFPLRYVIRYNIGEIYVRIDQYKQYDKKYNRIVRYINENTHVDDYICFLGERATFNSITGRKYPLRFTAFSGNVREEFTKSRGEFMDDLRTNKPVLIILNKEPFLGWGNWGEFPSELLGILKPYLDLNYLQVKPLGLDDFAIFRFNPKK